MRVSGGQVSENRGVDFASQVGLQGVTTRSAGRRLSADLDARVCTARSAIRPRSCCATTSTSSCTTTCMLDRGAHRVKFGATTSTCSSGPSSRTTRAARSPTPGSSAATRSPIFSSATRRLPSRASDAATRTAAPTGCICSRRTTGASRSNLTLNLGLRYEYNQHMRDEDNRLSSVDYLTPGGRFVIASDDDGNHQSRGPGAAAADSDSIRHVRSRPAGIAACSARARCASRRAPGLRCRSPTIARSSAAATASS